MKLPDVTRGVQLRALLVVFGCLVCQLGAGFFYATRVLSLDVIGELGWSRTLWSSGMPVMLAVSSFSQALVGTACARFGVRPVLAFSLVCLAATFVTLSFMQELWHFYLGLALLALGNAGIGDVVIGSVIARWFDRGRGIALGVALSGSNLGGVIFTHAIARLSETFSWRQAALGVGLAGVAAIAPVALLLVREPGAQEGREGRPDPTGSEAEAPGEMRVGTVLRQPAYWILFGVLFVYAFAQLGMADHLILYLTDLGYTRVEAAAGLEFAVGAGVLAKLGAGTLAVRLTPQRAFLANTLLLALALAILPLVGRAYLLPLFGLLFGVSIAARDVLLPLVVARLFGVRRFAQLYGILQVAFFPGGGLGPLLLAAARDGLGSYVPAFAAAAGLTLAAVVALAALPRPVSPPPPSGLSP